MGQKGKKKQGDENIGAATATATSKGKKRKAAEESENQTPSKASKTKETQDFKDKDFYIPYTKDNIFAEDG